MPDQVNVEDEAKRRIAVRMSAEVGPTFDPASIMTMVEMMMQLFSSLCGGSQQTAAQLAGQAKPLTSFQKAALTNQLRNRYREEGYDRKESTVLARAGINAAEQVTLEAPIEERIAFLNHVQPIVDNFDIF